MNSFKRTPGGMIDRFRNDVSRFDKPVGPSGSPRRRYRTIWISDVHLGTRGCNDRLLLDFLDHVDSAIFYLVGDIIDAWRLKTSFSLPERPIATVRPIQIGSTACRGRG